MVHGSPNHPNKSVIAGHSVVSSIKSHFKQSVAAYHTNGVLYGTVGMLITQVKIWLTLYSAKYYQYHIFTVLSVRAAAQYCCFQFSLET